MESSVYVVLVFVKLWRNFEQVNHIDYVAVDPTRGSTLLCREIIRILPSFGGDFYFCYFMILYIACGCWVCIIRPGQIISSLLRMTDEGSVPEMRIWSKLLIKSDLNGVYILVEVSFYIVNTIIIQCTRRTKLLNFFKVYIIYISWLKLWSCSRIKSFSFKLWFSL